MFGFLESATATPPSPAETSDARHKRIIAEAQADVETLLSYASGRVRIALPEDLVKSSVAVIRTAPDQMTQADEALLWQCLDRLTAAASPATAASVKLVTEIETDRHTRPGLFRARWRDPEGRRQIEWARRTMLMFLVTVLLCQIYAGLLTSILTNIKTHEKDLQETKEQISRIRQISEKNGANTQDVPEGEVARAIDERNEQAAVNLKGADLMLHKALTPWSILTGKAASQSDDPEAQATGSYAFAEVGQATLQALTVYVLPLLYGTLGAVAYILRRLSESIEQSTFALTAMYRYRLRLALGALLGSTVGLFFSPDSKLIPGLSLSLVATAFLIGYSVEVFFAFFDNLISRARQSLTSTSSDSGARQPAQPTDPVRQTTPETPRNRVGPADDDTGSDGTAGSETKAA